MKIVVVENNKDFNKNICGQLEKMLINNCFEWDVVSFLGYNDELYKTIHDREVKIYIVDIKLGNYSGYDICRLIRESADDWDSIIIIASIYNQKENFISLRLSIFTYLSKLCNFKEALEETVIHAIHILEPRKFLLIKKNCRIAVNDICYILKEKNSKYCFIKTLDDHFRIRRPLKSLESDLRLRRVKSYLLVNDRNIKYNNKDRIIFENQIHIHLD